MALLRPSTALGVLLLALATFGSEHQDDGRAAELAKLARDLAGRGEARQALALVQSELAPDLTPATRGLLQSTLGWLEHQLAGQDRANRMAHLEAARAWYVAGIAGLPDPRLARANLGLVDGDIALERGDRDGALAAWRGAIQLVPNLPGAGERFLEVLGSDARALAAEAQTLEASGHADLAREVWARAIRATPPEAQGEPCLRWLLSTAEAGAFTRDSVSGFPGGGAALAELRLLARDPLRAPTPSWAATPLGAHAVAAAYRSLAAERRTSGAATDALALLERGLAAAPATPLMGRPPVAAALATELLELLLEQPSLDLDGTRTADALARVLALDPSELAREPIEIGLARRAHTAAARALLARGERGERTREQLELALAAAALDQPGVEFPAPEVSAMLAALYADGGEIDRAIHAYLDAALGYLALGDRAAGEAALRSATALDLALGGTPRVRAVRDRFGLATPDLPVEPATPQDPTGPAVPTAPVEEGRIDGLIPRLITMDWSAPTAAGAFRPSAWYVGASIGGAVLSSSGGEIENDLSDLSYAVGVNLDDATTAYRVYGGYRFAQPFALEVGWADHGTIHSTVGPEPATGLAQFLSDLAKTHPATGAGPTLALRTLLVGNDDLSLAAKLGVWRWQSDIDVQTSTSKVKIDRQGTDPFYGLDLAWHPGAWGAIKLDVERYDIGDESTNVVSIGLEVDVAALLRP